MKKYLSIILCVVIFASICTISANAQDVQTYYYGDANKNGVIDILDVSVIQKHIVNVAGYDFDDIQMTVSDVDGNGEVNIDDVTLIQKYLSYELLTFPNVDPTNPTETNVTVSTEPTEPFGTDNTVSTEPSETVSTLPTETVTSLPISTESTESTTESATVKPTKPPIPTEPSEYIDINTYVGNKINAARRNAGLGYYNVSAALSNCAYGRAVEIVNNVSNTRPDGRKWYTILTDYYGLNPDNYYLSEHMVVLDTKNNNYTQEEIAGICVDALLNSKNDKAIFLEEKEEAKDKLKNLGVGVHREGNIYYLVIHLAG